MSHSPQAGSRFPVLRRLWKPAVATGAGGAAIAIWLEELVMFGQEILALIFLPIMAGAIFLLDIFMFKARMPKRDNTSQDKGAGK